MQHYNHVRMFVLFLRVTLTTRQGFYGDARIISTRDARSIYVCRLMALKLIDVDQSIECVHSLHNSLYHFRHSFFYPLTASLLLKHLKS